MIALLQRNHAAIGTAAGNIDAYGIDSADGFGGGFRRRLNGGFDGRFCRGFDRGLGGCFAGHLPAVALILFQILQGQVVADSGNVQRVSAHLFIDILLEAAYGGDGAPSVIAIDIRIGKQPDIAQHFLHKGDGFGIGGRIYEYVLALVRLLRRFGGGFKGGFKGRYSGGFDRRRCGRHGGRHSGRFDHAHVVLDAVFQIGERERIAFAAGHERLRAALIVDPVLEGLDRVYGAIAVYAVHIPFAEQTELCQHVLHAADVFRGRPRIDGIAGGRGRRRSGGRRGGGDCGLRGLRMPLLPPIDVVVQERHGVHIHHAGYLQRIIALQLIDAGLEVLDRVLGGNAVDAVRAAFLHDAQRDQLVLYGADIGARGIRVHRDIVRTGGDGRLAQRNRGIQQPLLSLFARNAVHDELFRRRAVIIDVGLEIAHRLLGGAVVGAVYIALIQPAEVRQILLQLRDIALRGAGADGFIIVRFGGIQNRRLARGLGGRLRAGGIRTGRGIGAARLVVVILIHIAGIGVIHPGKLRILQRREGGGGVGRGRRRDVGHPGSRGGRRRGQAGQRFLRGIAGAERIEQRQQADDRGDDDRRADGDIEHRAAPAARLFQFILQIIILGIARRGGVFALRDVRRAVFFKVEMALAGIIYAFHAGAELFHARFKGVLHARDGHDRAIVRALRAAAGQIFANADRAAALGIHRDIHDAVCILTQRAADQKAIVVYQRARQQLNLRYGGAGILAAMRADFIALHFAEAIHTKVLVCHMIHSLF